jgi:hypothetical protein
MKLPRFPEYVYKKINLPQIDKVARNAMNLSRSFARFLLAVKLKECPPFKSDHFTTWKPAQSHVYSGAKIPCLSLFFSRFQTHQQRQRMKVERAATKNTRNN